jgi:hypothetical protein
MKSSNGDDMFENFWRGRGEPTMSWIQFLNAMTRAFEVSQKLNEKSANLQ